MSRPPGISGRECAIALERLGFVFKRQRGTHMMYHKDEKRVVIPDHPELARGTLAAILRHADVSIEELLVNI